MNAYFNSVEHAPTLLDPIYEYGAICFLEYEDSNGNIRNRNIILLARFREIKKSNKRRRQRRN